MQVQIPYQHSLGNRIQNTTACLYRTRQLVCTEHNSSFVQNTTARLYRTRQLAQLVLLLVVFSAHVVGVQNTTCYNGTALQVAAGAFSACALLDTDGIVACWGLNDDGQLGQGDTDGRREDWATMGHFLPAIDLGQPAVGIYVGLYHFCAVLEDGTAKCWGARRSVCRPQR
jgi:alpha-tubulin suppressor-like RCC1 family protein